MTAAPERWRYGDAGDRWPVQFGDVWRAGPHVLACGDLELHHAAHLLGLHGPAQMAYVDPPWNAGNARAFRTKAGVGRPVDFSRFLGVLLGTIRMVRGACYVEMGRQHVADLETLAAACGAVVLNRWSTTYYRRHPAALVRLHWQQPGSSVASLASDCWNGLDDEDTPALAIEADSRPGGRVFDPCAGRGGTVRAAHALGRAALAMELNPRRLACAVDWLAARGLKPERVGSLLELPDS